LNQDRGLGYRGSTFFTTLNDPELATPDTNKPCPYHHSIDAWRERGAFRRRAHLPPMSEQADPVHFFSPFLSRLFRAWSAITPAIRAAMGTAIQKKFQQLM
jgi:hypothetical protein